MSIWTGKNGYEPLAEFRERTSRELRDRGGVVYRRDTEPPADEVAWVEEQLRGAESVLEIGSGFGIWAPVVRKLDASYVGVEPIGERVDEARRLHPYAQFIHGDGRSVRMLRRFDRVLLVTVLQHLPLGDALKVLETAHAHLAPDGKIVLLEARLIDGDEADAERRYADPNCAAGMIWKPIGAFKEYLPELEWRQAGRFDGFVLTRKRVDD